VEGPDKWAAARAEFSLVELGLQQETVTPDEAIERLDRLRFQWRGDELELDVLDRLGKLYLAKNDYRKGLNTLRTAVTYFPEKEKVKGIAQTMTESFRKLHLAGEADQLPPLKALALYDDFRELTPAGPEGDLMIQRLAERLVAVDLLDRAAGLLSHQVRYRLKGEERAKVGAKLALVLLLDRNPKGALSALRNSFQPNLPYEIEDDRRRIRAKATMDLGRHEEAIALLAGDVSREADLLRANIYWSTKDYAEAAKVLQRLSGDPMEEGAYPEDQARYVLSWAVALRLKRDEAGVKMLRDLYGPGMAKSKLAEAFAYISSESPDNAKNIEEMSKRIAETDKFDGFLKNYRERLMAPLAVAPKDGKEPAPADATQEPAAVSTPAPPQGEPAAVPPPPPPPPQG
jgi:tetratricopeptide (TPR) repeat protein